MAFKIGIKIDSKEYVRQYKKYVTVRKEVNRLYKNLSKNMRTIERNDLTHTTTYKEFQKFVSTRVGGQSRVQMDFAELKNELGILKRLSSNKTSTYTGIVKTLKQIANGTKMAYKNNADLISKSQNFFKVYERLQQHLKVTGGIDRNYSSDRIFGEMNVLIEREQINLGNENVDIDSMVNEVSKLVQEEHKTEKTPIYVTPYIKIT